MNSSDIDEYMDQLGCAAREASRVIARADSGLKNAALLAIAAALDAARDELLEANAADLAAARESGLDAALLDRLQVSDATVDGMIDGLRQVAALPDPVGEISGLSYRPSGIQVGRMRVPLGVVGIIYESRPNVTIDAAALCLKSGNAAVLRGGSEALRSNRALAAAIDAGLQEAGLPGAVVQVIATSDRAAVGRMIAMPEHIDVIVPRGGKGLIERIAREARVPVIKHLDGNCHLYVDASADLDMASRVVINAKTQRYGTCNTLESLLVSEAVATSFLPQLGAELAARGVELRACAASLPLLAGAQPATDADWATEYLAPVLSVKLVAGLDDAIEHINRYGSGHTDGILASDYHSVRRFLREVDSSSVMVNASTRFADGFEYGLGAEIGISTDKFHARGPVGLEGLTTLKYIVLGEGHIRQ